MFEEPILWSRHGPRRPAVDEMGGRGPPHRRSSHGHSPRRQAALTPPTGPVFLSLPMDLQSEIAELDLTQGQTARRTAYARPSSAAPSGRSAGPARKPGDPGRQPRDRGRRRGRVGAPSPSELGAPVISESGTTHGRLSFPADHPLYAPGLPLWSPEVRAAAGRLRRAAGRRHGPAAAIRLSRARARRFPNISSWSIWTRSVADRQELSGRSRSDGRFQIGPGRAGRIAPQEHDVEQAGRRPASAPPRSAARSIARATALASRCRTAARHAAADAADC